MKLHSRQEQSDFDLPTIRWLAIAMVVSTLALLPGPELVEMRLEIIVRERRGQPVDKDRGW
jgi:hypothetical protein